MGTVFAESHFYLNTLKEKKYDYREIRPLYQNSLQVSSLQVCK